MAPGSPEGFNKKALFFEQKKTQTFQELKEGIRWTRWYFNGIGLQVRILLGTKDALIDFQPRGARSHTPSARTEFLLTGYEDFKKVIELVDAGKLSPIETFSGETNQQMAEAARILGFTTEEGRKGKYQVYADFETVRAHLTALEERQTSKGQKLLEQMRERVEAQENQSPESAEDLAA